MRFIGVSVSDDERMLMIRSPVRTPKLKPRGIGKLP